MGKLTDNPLYRMGIGPEAASHFGDDMPGLRRFIKNLRGAWGKTAAATRHDQPNVTRPQGSRTRRWRGQKCLSDIGGRST